MIVNIPPSTVEKTVYVIVGPTAVGKTAAAISLAKYLDTEILSADSRQCYRELNIGVARPSPAELAMVKHYFIATHSIHDTVNAGVFETYGLEVLSEIFSKRDNAVIVGGTGLYIRALTGGIDELPKIDPATRAAIIHSYTGNGLSWLQEQVRQLDPLFFADGDIQNPQRLMRALEVIQTTGRSIRSFQTGKKSERPFKVKKIGLTLPREELYARINSRVDKMMEEGLLQEAESCFKNYVLPARYQPLLPPALNTVGYAELFQYFNKMLSLQEAVALIKQHTRNYAKRQLTWFRKDPEVEWMSPMEFKTSFPLS